MTFALYIHYPFCKSRCPYCGFATDVEQDEISAQYRKRLTMELSMRGAEHPWRGGSVGSIYIGGGTPSLMPAEYVCRLFDEIGKFFIIEPGIEITLEANPSSRDSSRFTAYRSCGINRLSIGAQSFHDDELDLLGRTHTPSEIRETVQIARDAGFENISLDLMYGIPGSRVESFAVSINRAIELKIDHLSTYSLSIEPNTPFQRSVNRGSMHKPNPDQAADQFATLCEIMSGAGFEHYELTNFAKPDKWSRHNFTYWRRQPYLGLGTEAHSFDGSIRFWNTRNTGEYISLIKSGESAVAGKENLTTVDALEEEVYLSLRTRDGLETTFLEKITEVSTIDELTDSGFLVKRFGRYHIPEDRWLLLDSVAVKLLSDMKLSGKQ